METANPANLDLELKQPTQGIKSAPASRPSSPPLSPAACAIDELAPHGVTSAPTTAAEPRRVLLVSDCAEDLVCGVTRKQKELCKSLNAAGHSCRIICATDFWGFHAPHWNEIKIAAPSPWAYCKLSRMIEDFDPDTIK